MLACVCAKDNKSSTRDKPKTKQNGLLVLSFGLQFGRRRFSGLCEQISETGIRKVKIKGDRKWATKKKEEKRRKRDKNAQAKNIIVAEMQQRNKKKKCSSYDRQVVLSFRAKSSNMRLHTHTHRVKQKKWKKQQNYDDQIVWDKHAQLITNRCGLAFQAERKGERENEFGNEGKRQWLVGQWTFFVLVYSFCSIAIRQNWQSTSSNSRQTHRQSMAERHQSDRTNRRGRIAIECKQLDQKHKSKEVAAQSIESKQNWCKTVKTHWFNILFNHQWPM